MIAAVDGSLAYRGERADAQTGSVCLLPRPFYNTRPWATYGEGPSHTGHGVRECTADDIRFTRNKANTVLYAIICGWPGDNAEVDIASLKKSNINLSNLARVELLGEETGTCTKLAWKQDNEGMKIEMPGQKPCVAGAYPIRLSFSDTIPSSPVLTMRPSFIVEDVGSGVQTGTKSKRKKTIPVKLDAGEYTTARLKELGIMEDSISSVKVNAGWKVVLYSDDSFSGKSLVVTGFIRNIGHASYNFGKRVGSIKVIKAEKAAVIQ